MSGQLNLRTDFSSFVHSLSDVKEVLAKLQHYVCDIKEYRNTLVPVFALPEDVLLEIFTQLIYLYDPRDSYAHRPHRSIYATHVCRRWRKAALSFPTLWTRIYVTKNQERLAAFFERSAGCTLIFGSKGDRLWWTESVDLALKKYSNCLDTAWSLGIDPEAATILEITPTDGPLCFPQLETFRVALVMGVRTVPALTNATMPRLNYLSCSRVPFVHLADWIRPTLTRLHVFDNCDERGEVSDWVRLLEGLLELEELHVECDIAPPDLQSVEKPPKCRAHLHKLRNIRLSTTANYTSPNPIAAASYAHLLQHISHPSDAHIFLQGRWHDDQHWLAECQYVLSCFADTPSPPSMGPGIGQTTSTAR